MFDTSAPIVPLPDVTAAAGAPPTVVDLSGSFNDGANRTRVAFGFDAGRVLVELYDDAAPQTVANFLNYARTGRYDDTVVHRSVDLNTGEPFVIQGGGYHSPDLNHIATDAPVVNEFRPDTVQRGTIAMAKLGGQPDSATSEWFFNLRDNKDILDAQSGGFTSFGQVIANGMTVVDAIAALPTLTQAAPGGSLANFPVEVNPPASPQDWVDVQYIAELPELVSVTSSDPTLVTPTLQGTTLTLSHAPGSVGTATITVNAVDRLGAAVTDTFDVQVALESADVAVGTGAARGVTYADADGTAGVITVTGGTATVRVSGIHLTQTAGRTGTAVGGDLLEVAGITVTGGSPSITVRGTGGDGRLVVNGVTSAVPVRRFSGRPVALRGTADFAGGVGRLELARADGATLNLGGANASVTILAATDTDLTAAGAVRTLRVGSWTGTDADRDVITAPAIRTLQSGGDFTGDLALTGAPGTRVLNSVKVLGAVPSGTWSTTGAVGSVSVGSTGAAWSGAFGQVNSFKVTGDLSGTLTAGSVRSVRAGSVTSAVIALTQGPGTGLTNLGSLNSAGAISGTSIRSAGNIGSITAASMTGSSIFAGVEEPAGLPVALPDAATDFVPGVSIRALNVRNRTAASFSGSYVAAASLGRMNLGVVNTANGGVPFGLAALDLASLTAVDGAGAPIRARRLTDPAGSIDQGDFKVRVF
jgi:cyclophilin family peptidyl-prolyl cis-trans isomerase